LLRCVAPPRSIAASPFAKHRGAIAPEPQAISCAPEQL
jgi:hypothetical protein